MQSCSSKRFNHGLTPMNTDKDPLFMTESRLSPSPMHWDHELRMCKCLEINRGVFRFMESFSLKQPTSRKRLILSWEIRIHPCSSVVTTLHDSGFSVKGAR